MADNCRRKRKRMIYIRPMSKAFIIIHYWKQSLFYRQILHTLINWPSPLQKKRHDVWLWQVQEGGRSAGRHHRQAEELSQVFEEW